MKVGDRVKIRRTEETFDLGIAHQVGTIVAERGDGDLVTVELRLGRLVKLCREEVTPIGDDALAVAEAFLGTTEKKSSQARSELSSRDLRRRFS